MSVPSTRKTIREWLKLSVFSLSISVISLVPGHQPAYATTAENKSNEMALMSYVWPTIESAGKAGRVYYRGQCQSGGDNSMTFPRLDLQAPLTGQIGLVAMRHIFGKVPHAHITERDGVITIRI